jgi:hypothetical protein
MGAVVALGVAMPLVVLGALLSAFLVWRRKRRQRSQGRAAAPAWEKTYELPTKSQDVGRPASLHEIMSEEVMAEMPGSRQFIELAE